MANAELLELQQTDFAQLQQAPDSAKPDKKRIRNLSRNLLDLFENEILPPVFPLQVAVTPGSTEGEESLPAAVVVYMEMTESVYDVLKQEFEASLSSGKVLSGHFKYLFPVSIVIKYQQL